MKESHIYKGSLDTFISTIIKHMSDLVSSECGAALIVASLGRARLRVASVAHPPRKELYLYFSHQPPEHIPVVYERQWNPTV